MQFTSTNRYRPGPAESGGRTASGMGTQAVADRVSAADSDETAARLSRLVLCLAGRLLARIPRDSGIEISDLIQAGNVGLIQAARTYSPSGGTPLAGYAKFRIRGEMLDTVRRHSGRGASGAFRRRTVRDDGGTFDLAEQIAAPAEHSPIGLLASAQRAAILSRAISRLPARYRVVIRLRYSRGLSLREIGEYLEVNESRACQIHRAALVRLRKMLCTEGVTGFSQLI